MKIESKYFNDKLNPISKNELDSCFFYYKYYYINGILKKIYEYEVLRDGKHKIWDLKYFMYKQESIEEVKKECYAQSDAFEILFDQQIFENYTLWNNKTFYKLKEIEPEKIVKELFNDKFWSIGLWEYNRENNELIGGAKYVYRQTNMSDLNNFMFGFHYDEKDTIEEVLLDYELSNYFENSAISLEQFLKFIPDDRERLELKMKQMNGWFNYDFLWSEKTWYHSLLPIVPKSGTI